MENNNISHITTLRGHPFHYVSWGDPTLPPLLFLHGFPEYSGVWDDIATRLSSKYYCVAPDQRGYGISYAPQHADDYVAAELVADMVELIKKVGVKPSPTENAQVTVVGHDWGASVAYGLAMFAPKRVKNLIVINGVHPVPFQRAMAAGGAQSEASQYINFLRQEGSESQLSAKNYERLLGLFAAKMDMSWMTLDKVELYMREWSRPGRLRGMINWYRASPLLVADPGKPITNLREFPIERLMVNCPHLLIWGQNDTALLPESHAGLETYAPDLTRVNIEDGDHWVCHQQPDKVANTISNWLDDRDV